MSSFSALICSPLEETFAKQESEDEDVASEQDHDDDDSAEALIDPADTEEIADLSSEEPDSLVDEAELVGRVDHADDSDDLGGLDDSLIQNESE